MALVERELAKKSQCDLRSAFGARSVEQSIRWQSHVITCHILMPGNLHMQVFGPKPMFAGDRQIHEVIADLSANP